MRELSRCNSLQIQMIMIQHFYQSMLGQGMIFEIEKGFPRGSQECQARNLVIAN